VLSATQILAVVLPTFWALRRAISEDNGSPGLQALDVGRTMVKRAGHACIREANAVHGSEMALTRDFSRQDRN
jgi:hypothetical protein